MSVASRMARRENSSFTGNKHVGNKPSTSDGCLGNTSLALSSSNSNQAIFSPKIKIQIANTAVLLAALLLAVLVHSYFFDISQGIFNGNYCTLSYRGLFIKANV
jgi:hypothetical protein